MKSGKEIIEQARSRLLAGNRSPFFGICACKLEIKEFPEKREGNTFAVDGTNLFFDDDFLRSLDIDELEFIIAHEVSHVALLHTYRLEGRDMQLANIAADHAVNLMLKDSGFTVLKDCLCDSKYKGMSFEQIYALVLKEADPPKQPKGCPTGEIQPPPKPEEQQEGSAPGTKIMTELDWQITAQQALTVSLKAGDVSGRLRRFIKENTVSKTDWKEVLRKYFQAIQSSDYTWQKPNKAYLSHGMYLPGIEKESCPRVVAAIDTSGSISDETLSMISVELTESLHTVKPEELIVLYCDTKIQREETYTPDDDKVELKPYGGGGTRFKPVFDHIAEMDNPPALVLFFTDTCAMDLDQLEDPGIPVLWVVPIAYERYTANLPFWDSIIIMQDA